LLRGFFWNKEEGTKGSAYVCSRERRSCQRVASLFEETASPDAICLKTKASGGLLEKRKGGLKAPRRERRAEENPSVESEWRRRRLTGNT